METLHFDEHSLRELLNSAYGPRCVQTIIAQVERDADTAIQMEDGTRLRLADADGAYRVLREQFGWVRKDEPHGPSPEPESEGG